jgi:hypothetical protein
MAESGYVLAGCETLFTILNNFSIRNTKNRFEDHFTPKQVSDFLSSKCHGFLHSFGQNFSGKRSYAKYIDNEASIFEFIRDSGFGDDCILKIDSGGFQASVGRIDKSETQLLIDLYYQFVRDKHEVFDRAFILDLPPGPGCTLFDSFDDIYTKNLETYNIAKNLPDEARKKIVYIHHFRTPKLWDIYTDILNQDGMFEAFDYFGTGGIVANMASDVSIPCIIYVLPLIPILKKAIEAGRDKLKFHILGGSNFRDILFYELFQKHVKVQHGIELEMTFDSSGLYKGLMIGRYFYHVDNGIIKKVDIRSPNLDKRYNFNKNVIDIYDDVISELSIRNNFKPIPINMNTVYDDETGTFFEEVKVYTMFCMLDRFAQVQQLMKSKVEEIYSLYENGDLEEFNKRIELITRNINAGKITKKQKAKSTSIIRSLDMLTALDTDNCKYIVDKCLAKDEFMELDPTSRLLTV